MSDKCDLYGAEKVPKGYAEKLSKEIMYRQENEQLKQELEEFKKEREEFKLLVSSDTRLLMRERMDKYVCAAMQGILSNQGMIDAIKNSAKEYNVDFTQRYLDNVVEYAKDGLKACKRLVKEVKHG